MKLRVRSLFLKIFICFWGTAIVTAVALVLVFVFGPRSVPGLWHTTLTETARYMGQTVIESVEAGGPATGSAYLGRRQKQSGLRACLFDPNGQRISGEHCGNLAELVSQLSPQRSSYFDIRYGLARLALTLDGSTGKRYAFVTELPAGPRAALGMSGLRIGAEFSLALLVSGFVCLLLTRYLTLPIYHLREASQKLAAGNFGVRAPADIRRRHDEIGDLVRDFDAMAEQIESLVQQQRQLLSDISHELRSPLARLNVALDLGRLQKGDDLIFEHMERDLGCLNDMIARLLTVATLDSGLRSTSNQPINLTEVIGRISEDARFESQQKGVTIEVIAAGDAWISGDPTLLHSALENVIRNATRYTFPGSCVRIQMQLAQQEALGVHIVVCDEGPGVPEADLGNIFRPFFRVATARDRDSGGTGLGLAIADRVVRLHGGTISARNRPPLGLEVDIRMPHVQHS